MRVSVVFPAPLGEDRMSMRKGSVIRKTLRYTIPEMTAHALPHDDEPHEDHFVHLGGVTWADYQRLLKIRGDHSAPRITFLEGTLEIMSPSIHHESIKGKIGCLVEVWCLEHGVEFSTLGSWTLESKKQKRGAEPDECYVFGGVKNPKRPDLAIEVVWTSGGLDKLAVYSRLGVPEVWFWRRGRIHPYVLRGKTYAEVDRSAALPEIDLSLLASFLDRPTTSQAIREYRAALVR
jgi:Uma2 family endonuclease